MRSHRLLFLPALVAVIGLFGCGPKELPRAAVSGQIKSKGVLLPVGTVTFVSQEGNTVETGPIKDGRYTIARAPVGAVKIAILTPPPENSTQMKQKVEGKAAESSTKVVTVPQKYNNADQSGLTYTVTAEKTQTHNIDLP